MDGTSLCNPIASCCSWAVSWGGRGQFAGEGDREEPFGANPYTSTVGRGGCVPGKGDLGGPQQDPLPFFFIPKSVRHDGPCCFYANSWKILAWDGGSGQHIDPFSLPSGIRYLELIFLCFPASAGSDSRNGVSPPFA